MQISNDYHVNYQQNFKGVRVLSPLKEALVKGTVSAKRKLQIDKFINKYKDSKVTILLGRADNFGDRLDAQVFYGAPRSNWQKETFAWFGEKKFSNLFGISPKKFLKYVGKKVKSVEQLVKSAEKNPGLKKYLEGSETKIKELDYAPTSWFEELRYSLDKRISRFLGFKV